MTLRYITRYKIKLNMTLRYIIRYKIKLISTCSVVVPRKCDAKIFFSHSAPPPSPFNMHMQKRWRGPASNVHILY